MAKPYTRSPRAAPRKLARRRQVQPGVMRPVEMSTVPSVRPREEDVGQTPKRRALDYLGNGPRGPNSAQMTSTATAKKTSCGNPMDAITVLRAPRVQKARTLQRAHQPAANKPKRLKKANCLALEPAARTRRPQPLPGAR